MGSQAPVHIRDLRPRFAIPQTALLRAQRGVAVLHVLEPVLRRADGGSRRGPPRPSRWLPTRLRASADAFFLPERP
jgi:hypothetical protein